MVESCDLGVTYKRLTGETRLDARMATLLVSNMRCTMLEDRENPSAAQGDDKIIPAIANSSISSAMSDRMKVLIKAIRKAARVSSDLERKGTVEGEDVPLPSEESRRLESLVFSRYKLRSAANENADDTVVSRSKHQLNKYCIRCETIMETKTRRGETDEARGKRIKLGDENELVSIERKQPKTITAETHPDALWTYIINLDTAGVEGLRNNPSTAGTYESQTYDHVQIPLEITGDSHARVKRFTTSLLRILLPLQREGWDRRSLCKRIKMSAVPHPHYLVNTSFTLVITIMYLNQWQDNMLPTRPLQGINLVAPLQVFLKSPSRTFGRPRSTAPILCSRVAWKASRGAAMMMLQTDLVLVTSIFSIYALLSAIVPA